MRHRARAGRSIKEPTWILSKPCATSSSITPDATFETLDIDSLDTFDIIFEAEERFGIKVPNQEVAITTVQDVVSLLDRLRVEQGKA